ncbi:unnamed protein product [Phytophthora fragariaefolia]|uniref:Unnamed protein product n=1 Tax=Phytophthora fragariaefolia TaxID=1490495 RepID=A0A9W6TYS0_9STRA|nr:unnamed protein product [Phytophthora fragariaefolia]
METITSPLFSFDNDELSRLQLGLPADLQLLRLRLRFGLPVHVRIGQRFRVVVDVVDEMGQPMPRSVSLPNGIDLTLANHSFSTTDNEKDNSEDIEKIVLNIEEVLTPKNVRLPQNKWVFWASLRYSGPSNGLLSISSGVHVNLRVQVKQIPELSVDSNTDNSPRQLLRTFCVGSAWVSERVLILPLQVSLQVGYESESVEENITSTACQRLFRTIPWINSTRDKVIRERGVLVVDEHYGDAMGAHVWDASILLSWALLRAGIRALSPVCNNSTNKVGTTQAILELGSGCGLFAAVLATLQPPLPQVKTIFTEKVENTDRLQKNLDQNGSQPSASVIALKWGKALPKALQEANVCVVFAADVLYNWAAHEDFLATLDYLVQSQGSNTKVHVFLAHKRRGQASVEKLDALASNTFDRAARCSGGKTNCRWIRWHIKKIASLARVDLFELAHE